jgi:hypothetical protein
MLVCVNFDKNEATNYNKFELDIHSDHKLDFVKPNNLFNLKKKTFEIYGKWDNFNSGGGIDEITFFKNPYYELIVNKPTDSYIEVITQHGYLVSLLIFESFEKEISPANVLNNSQGENKISYSEELFYVRSKFETGKRYFIVPFTKFPKQVLLI